MERDISILKRRVGQLDFANPLIFGGGTCKTLEDVRRAARSDVGGIEIGTITPHNKDGNKGPNVFYAHFEKGVLIFTLNSLGLLNAGRVNVNLWARTAIALAHDAGKMIGINVAADTPTEVVEMVLWGIDCGFDWVTINGGCPNKYDADGKPLTILSQDTNAIIELIGLLEDRVPAGCCEIWWKPAPFTDTVNALPKHAVIIGKSFVLTGYIANNTVPHCFQCDEEGHPTITPSGGLGGMGGPAVKPMALGHLQLLHKFLPSRIALIGSGGTTYGRDVADYLRSHAKLVHAASVVWAYPEQKSLGYGEANRILAECMELPDLEDVLNQK